MIDREKSRGLKKCPFCGGKAHLHYLEKEHPYPYRVQCSLCFCTAGSSYSYSEYKSAIENWNTRHINTKNGIDK